MNLNELIAHPERMDRETLYDLRSLIALHPYYQTARLLMLQNLYLLHDTSFDEELRRAAIYITDRRVLFDMIEAAHYRLRSVHKAAQEEADSKGGSTRDNVNRTTELINNFLGSIPDEEDKEKRHGRKPTPADAAVDYVAYLEQCGEDILSDTATPQMKGQNLIDDFISRDGRIVLPEIEEEHHDMQEATEPVPDDICTETMAQIYVRQGRYTQALEIIRRLHTGNRGKNAYYADQIRFLEKLIINNKNKKQ
ncbi:MAG: tetratricopeptide repeat protein [Prevotella sp.]